MSTITTTPEAVTLTLPQGPFSASDLDDIPCDGRKWEVIDGMLVVNPSPIGRHQTCVGELYVLLRAACPSELRVILSPYDWVTPSGDRLEPDLLVVRRSEFESGGHLHATPLLCAEVLSPSNPAYDTAVKRARYEALGVPAYWMADPVSPGRLVALNLVGGQYQEVADCSGAQPFEAAFPFPVRVLPSDLVD